MFIIALVTFLLVAVLFYWGALRFDRTKAEKVSSEQVKRGGA